MRRRALRRLLVALAVLALLPIEGVNAAGVHAQDIQPTVTMDPIGATIYRGDQEHFVAHVANGTQGAFFQQSLDGTTWATYTGSSQSGGDPNTWSGGTEVLGSVPLGTRWIRAWVPAASGFLEAFSDPQQQDVLIHDSHILDIGIYNKNGGVVLPDTTTARLYADGDRAAPVLDELVDGSWQELTTGYAGNTYIDLGPLGEGDRTFRARIDDSDIFTGSSEELTVHVVKGATNVQWMTSLTVQAHHTLHSQVSWDGPYGGVAMDGDMSVTDMATSTVIATGSGEGMEFDLPPMSVGKHDFLASYLGNADYAPSQKVFTVTVVADAVDATGVGLDTTTFYPIVDGYRDVVHARGTRQEPASVAVGIYNSAGTRVRLLSASRASGAYSIAWNGKSTSGTLQPAGKYRVVQTLTDAFGSKKTVTSYVTLSRKRIYTYTTYLNKTTPTRKATSWAGWQFTLPSATLYKSLAFQVYGRSVTVPGAEMGGWDSRQCGWSTTLSPSCVSSWTPMGFTNAWYSKALSVTYNRHGSYVRGFVETTYGSGVVYKVRLKVTYGVLK